MLFKRLAVILFCLSFFANKELSALSDFWYTGYHYDARQLLNHYKISDAFQSQHIEDKINGINWCYLNHQYDSMNMLFKQAIGQAKSTGSLDQLYKLYNLHVERNHFAGRYYYAEKCLKTYLKEVPDNYSVASFLRLNRIKLLTKSFSLQGSLVSQFELDSLQNHFLEKFVKLAKENGTQIIFLNIPLLKETQSDEIVEKQCWPERFSGEVELIGIRPTELFQGISEKDRQDLYYDPRHFNANGQELYTRSILPALGEVYAK